MAGKMMDQKSQKMLDQVVRAEAAIALKRVSAFLDDEATSLSDLKFVEGEAAVQDYLEKLDIKPVFCPWCGRHLVDSHRITCKKLDFMGCSWPLRIRNCWMDSDRAKGLSRIKAFWEEMFSPRKFPIRLRETPISSPAPAAAEQ